MRAHPHPELPATPQPLIPICYDSLFIKLMVLMIYKHVLNYRSARSTLGHCAGSAFNRDIV
jgi:hypothetical protein